MQPNSNNVNNQGQKARSPHARPDQSKPTRTKVFLVDDHRSYRESLRASLTIKGFEVVGESRNGEDAVDLVAAVRPDVVLMDISMPGEGGIEAAKKISERSSDVRIIMLTMHADQNLLSDSIKAGATGYLVKDCSVEDLTQAINTVISGETALSPNLAASVLAEVKKFESQPKAERIITKREEEVLQLIADGFSTPEVAEPIHLTKDSQEPPSFDLPEARRP